MKTKPTYSDLLRQFYDWQWECDFRTSIQDSENYLYACKQMSKFERLMKKFSAVNSLKAA